MITLSSDLNAFYRPDIALMHILCLRSAFKGSALEEDMWVQTDDGRPCGAIAKNGGRLYVFSDGGNTEELKEFINTVGFSEVFTTHKTANKLGLIPAVSFNVLMKKAVKTKAFYPESIGLTSLYNGLGFGEDEDISLPEFQHFAADISHRLRHGAAAAVVCDEGAALAFLCDKGAVINGISVKKEKRGLGIGSRLLDTLLCCCDRDVFVCANGKNTEFYIKNGFVPMGTAVIAR